MTTITLPRATVEQALGALELGHDIAKAEADRYHVAMAGFRPERHAQMDAEVQQIAAAMTALRAALAQQAEPTGKKSLQVESVVAENATTQQQIEQTPPSDYRRGYWDGFLIGKREGRIEAEDAAKQAEPVAYLWVDPETQDYVVDRCDHPPSELIPVYTTPPQRKRLTQEQLYALYDEHATHQEEGPAMSWWFDFARAIERAHGITGDESC